MSIPEPAWSAAIAGALLTCLFWQRRSRSRHLAVATVGLGIVMALCLPPLFGDLFGYAELTRYADMLLPEASPNPYTPYIHESEDAGSRLVVYCNLFEWIGVAIFSLGLWRHAKELANKSDPHPFPR